MVRDVVIFDLDGTLLNTLEDLMVSTNFALAQLGYKCRTKNEICSFVGDGISKLIERALPEGTSKSDFDLCLNIFKTHYSKNMFNHTLVYNDIIRNLELLRNNNCKIAVVSNKYDVAVKELCKKYFKDLIDIAMGEDETRGVKKKPAPDTILRVIAELGTNCKSCVYVGDSDVDILTAQNAEIPCISVSWGFRSSDFLKAHGAKIIIHSPNDLLPAISNLD